LVRQYNLRIDQYTNLNIMQSLDLDDEAEKLQGSVQWSPITLICKHPKLEEATTGQIVLSPALLTLSQMLSTTRSFDTKESKIYVAYHPEAVELVLRFSRMVLRYNSQADLMSQLPIIGYFRVQRKDGRPSSATTIRNLTISTAYYMENKQKNLDESKMIPANAAPDHTYSPVLLSQDEENKMYHLNLMLANDVQLGQFLDELTTQPVVLYECLCVSEHLQMEPAFSVFQLKWLQTLFGLSSNFIDLTWPKMNHPINNSDIHSHMHANKYYNQENVQIDNTLIRTYLIDALNRTNKKYYCPRTITTTGSEGSEPQTATNSNTTTTNINTNVTSPETTNKLNVTTPSSSTSITNEKKSIETKSKINSTVKFCDIYKQFEESVFISGKQH
jgi:hypothetical protein